MHKVLPTTEPPIIGYHFHMYPLSVLAYYNEYLPWFYSNYIHLVRFKDKGLNFFIHPFRQPFLRYFSTCPWIEIHSIDMRLIGFNTEKLISFITSCLNNEYYVQFFGDYYCIPDRHQYKVEHFLHEIFVSGYNDTSKEVVITGINRNGKYGKSVVTYIEIEQALTIDPALFSSDTTTGKSVPTWLEDMLDNPRFVLYKHKKQAQFVFDVSLVLLQIKLYIESVDVSVNFNMMTNSPDGVWGLAIYSDIAKLMLNSCGSSINLDYISFHILWEHKKCMYSRLRFMEEEGHLSGAYSCEYEQVERMANRLRLMILKYIHTADQSIIERGISLLEELKKSEVQVLTNLLTREYANRPLSVQ